MSNSLGLIETVGLAPCLMAADAMGKAADVELVGMDNMGSGKVSVMVRGDVGAVTAAVSAGVSAAGEVGEVIAHNVIARPVGCTNAIVAKHEI